jgi:hypothetical protein
MRASHYSSGSHPMIKLWLVLRVFNEVLLSAGPLTMDLSRCEAWAARERESLVIDRDTGVKPEDVTVTCERSEERPGVKSRDRFSRPEG